MPLTDAKIRAAKPEAKPYKLADGEGLFLYISPAGGKSWRMKFRTAGKEKLLVLGSYPALGLQDARRQRRAAKERIDEGGDPAADKQAVRQATRQKAETTFRAVAGAWHENERGKWDAKYADLIWRRLEDNIFPAIGSVPIDEITPPEMLAALKRVEARGVLETTRRVKQYCSNIFCFAIATGLCHNGLPRFW
jgi:hypothetical protein